eukprot:TRINITY_DN2649_c0_g1_i2.p1 TRINITY_DN2649_c0_g1~~TRINITY_DN2649_c0_g1_i2.p1  ORF type:complete len:258 (+),score=58.30 TRINITY_DN2649_c0_g1_i2:71-844(+)
MRASRIKVPSNVIGSTLIFIAAGISLSVSDPVTSEGASSVPNGLPCVRMHNQLRCSSPGAAYPVGKISSFIDEHKALVKRMFGDMVEPAPPPAPSHKTPASTIYFRSSTSFKATRFSRSVLEGYLEDFTDEESSFVPSGNRTKRQAGFPGRSTKEDPNKVDSCESTTELRQPYWAENSSNKIRAIVNTKQFNQAVHTEICSTSRTVRCAGDCACEQKYKWHRLLAYDPNDDCRGIFMDWFLFPSCCSCRCLKDPGFK